MIIFSQYPIQNSKLFPNSKIIIFFALHYCALRGCPKSFKSKITPHTLANFQSLPKLITLIINYFYSHCRGDWQIALTKPNFSDRLNGGEDFHPSPAQACSLCLPPPARASLQLVPNSKFKIQNSEFKITEPSAKVERRMSEG